MKMRILVIREIILWARHRIGRRGAFLFFLAILDAVFAYYLLDPPPRSPPQPYPLLSVEFWGAWWALTSLTCALGMFMKSDRVPYALAALIKTGWGLRYAYLWYVGVAESWAAMTIWLVFSLTVVTISGWPEELVMIPASFRGDGHDN